MKRANRRGMSVWAAALAATALLASVSGADEVEDSVAIAKPAFKASQEINRVVKGGAYIKTGGLDDAWMEPTMGSIAFQARKNERLGLDVTVAFTYFAAPYHYDQVQNYTRNISVTAPKLDASYVFGDVAHPALRVDAGIFNYKYNENARDLGEYMFRTWAYPGIVATGGAYGYIGNNSATLTGLKVQQPLGAFTHELMATIETDLTPVYDLNLTYMAKLDLGDGALKLGAGLQIARLLRADGDKETELKYFQENGTWYGEASGYYKSWQTGIQEKLAEPGADAAKLNAELARATDALAVLDSLATGQINPEIKKITNRAIKPMAWFAFDPKILFGGSDLLGAKDLIVYGEAILLGAQNYPVFYDKIGRRIPVMAGFNVPTFRVLDVLSVEFEYYGSQLPPTFKPSQPNATPVPVTPDSYYPEDWDKDNLKWSVYAERNLVRGVTLTAQVASDHGRSWDWNYYGRTPWEIYTSPSKWYWGVKLGVAI